MKIENKYFKKALEKQCSYVDVDLEDIDGKNKDDPFFLKHTWTEEEQDEFHDWLVEYFKDRKVAKSLTNYSYLNKKKREKVASEWILSWGWKCNYK